MNDQRLVLPEGKHLCVEYHSPDRRFPRHWHAYFEIELVLSGTGSYSVNDRDLPYPAFNAFFLGSTDFHALQTEEKTRLINVSFDQEAVEDRDLSLLLSPKTPRAFRLKEDALERLRAAAELLKHECDERLPCTGELLHYLIRSLLSQGSETAPEAEPSSTRAVKEALAYLQLNFRERITLSELAAKAGYQKGYFSELFQAVTGEGFLQTLTKLRVGYARTLLARGYSVSDACFLSGFGSLSCFLTAFKKQTGLSPREYRRQKG